MVTGKTKRNSAFIGSPFCLALSSGGPSHIWKIIVAALLLAAKARGGLSVYIPSEDHTFLYGQTTNREICDEADETEDGCGAEGEDSNRWRPAPILRGLSCFVFYV
jgi:hypothetical protein